MWARPTCLVQLKATLDKTLPVHLQALSWGVKGVSTGGQGGAGGIEIGRAHV